MIELVETRTMESSIASAAGKLLRDHFGKGPGSLFVTVEKPFITIYLKNFLAPMENVLLEQNNALKVQETRDLLMSKIKPDLQVLLSAETNHSVGTIRYDWNLEKRTGILFAELQTNPNEFETDQLDYKAKKEIHEEIERFTKKAQKSPRNIKSFKLNDRTIISKREDILVCIENELINTGFEEQLRLSKRKLEKHLIQTTYLETVLEQAIEDVFVDWDFDSDTGYVIFILHAPNK